MEPRTVAISYKPTNAKVKGGQKQVHVTNRKGDSLLPHDRGRLPEILDVERLTRYAFRVLR